MLVCSGLYELRNYDISFCIKSPFMVFFETFKKFKSDNLVIHEASIDPNFINVNTTNDDIFYLLVYYKLESSVLDECGDTYINKYRIKLESKILNIYADGVYNIFLKFSG